MVEGIGQETRMAAEAAEAAKAEEARAEEPAAPAEEAAAEEKAPGGAPKPLRVPMAVARQLRNEGAEQGMQYAWRWARFLYEHGGPGYLEGLTFDEALDKFAAREDKDEVHAGDLVVSTQGVFRVEALLETGDDDLGPMATGHLEGLGTPVQMPAWGCVTYRPKEG